MPALVDRAISEFAFDPVYKIRTGGTCTITALEVCMASVDRRSPSQNGMLALYRDMRGKGLLTNVNGACTVRAVGQEARDKGYTVALEWDYAGDRLPHDWIGSLRQNAGIRPILLQFALGRNLIDAETGVRDEAAARGLAYHAACVVGIQPNGYVVCDGDHPQVTSRFQIYNLQTLINASVCGLLMLEMKEGAPVMDTSWAGWEKQGDGMLGPRTPKELGSKQFLCRGGILAMLQKRPDLRIPGDMPIADITGPDDLGRYHQRFLMTQYYWASDTDCGMDWAGQALSQAEQHAAQLQAALDEEHAAPSSGLSEQQQKDLAVMAAIRGALG